MSIEEEVKEALDTLHLSAPALARLEVRALRAAVVQRYGTESARSIRSLSWPLWGNLDPEAKVSCHRPQAWQDFATFPEPGPLLLWTEEELGWEVPSAAAVAELLGETAPFELIVSDRALDAVAIWNHHDWLIGLGRAREWVRSIGGSKRGRP